MAQTAVTRRTALRVAAGAGATLASGALPAWARTFASAGTVLGPGSRPFPHLPEGTPSMPQIEHIVVLMMENHSFDNILGMLPHRYRSRRGVDGLPVDRHGKVTAWNPAPDGTRVYGHRAATPCQPGNVSQAWNASHISFDNGKNDGFVRSTAKPDGTHHTDSMLYYDQGDLPVTYSLASHFPIGERYFCSCLAQTYPNRRFFFAGTASGTIATRTKEIGEFVPPNGTIFDRLTAHGITWTDYYQNLPSPAIVGGVFPADHPETRRKVTEFFADAAHGRLPEFSFVEPLFSYSDEENPEDMDFGEAFIHDVVSALIHSPNWKSTALFITYDEHGGYYDHVPPPRAIAPDSTLPMTSPGDEPGGYDRYGFRVPLIVVSPWARANYASRIVQDHTSMTRFIERKWNIGALTYRDANAHDLTDYFDFRHRPAFLHPPALAAAPNYHRGLAKCKVAGLTPPVPPGLPVP